MHATAPTPARAGRRPWAAALALAACTVAGPAAAMVAAPVTYGFTTATGPYGNAGGPVMAFAPGQSVSGQFLYDAAGPATGTTGNGATIYNGSFTGLQGSVQGGGPGRNFSDPSGYTAVGDEIASFGPGDWVQLGADPTTGTHNFSGFAVPGWTLVNVRLFWIEGQQGVGDLTDSGEGLPAHPPAGFGRLALDFVPTGTSGPQNWVFFDGLQVAAVPEPATGGLLAAGLGVLGAAVRRRRQGAAALT